MEIVSSHRLNIIWEHFSHPPFPFHNPVGGLFFLSLILKYYTLRAVLSYYLVILHAQLPYVPASLSLRFLNPPSSYPPPPRFYFFQRFSNIYFIITLGICSVMIISRIAPKGKLGGLSLRPRIKHSPCDMLYVRKLT